MRKNCVWFSSVIFILPNQQGKANNTKGAYVFMKIRITGLPQQVEAMVSTIEEYYGLQINYVSQEYPQTRKCKSSKYVAVYLDVQDFEE